MDSRDSDGRTAIMEAAWGGHTEAMKTLIEGGKDTSIDCIVENGSFQFDQDFSDILLPAGSYIDLESEDGSTALIYAAGEGHVEAVELLINEGNFWQHWFVRGLIIVQ